MTYCNTPTEKEICLANQIVELLFKNNFEAALNYHFEERSSGGKGYFLGYLDWIDNHGELLQNFGIQVFRGETKCCIISEALESWVIKIGFARSSNPDLKDSIKDYCEKECEIYWKACDNNLQNYFAATYNIGEIHNIPIFLQEYAEPNELYITSKLREYAEYRINPDEFEDEDEYFQVVEDTIYDMEAEDKVKAIFGEDNDTLVDFIIDFGINDLHDGNWGVTNDNRIVIIDFSGFHG